MDSQRMLATFLDLVRIPSPSRHEGAVAQYCLNRLKQLGCEAYIDDSASQTGSETGNVIGILKGTAPGRIFITAHMDTVKPAGEFEPQVREGYVYSEGTTVLGADDKTGITVALETIATLAEGSEPHPEICAIFTTCEEIGLLGSSNVSERLFHHELALVCDGDSDPGDITIGSAFQYAFKLVFHGLASHAGVAPEKGISAIEMAAAAISGMELGRIDDDTTANIGSIEGGGLSNVVADTCTVIGECRAMTPSRLDDVRDQILSACKLSSEAYGGEFESDFQRSVEGYLFDEDDDEVSLVTEAASSIGLTPRTNISCGATDGNCYAMRGAVPIVLGTGVSDEHTTREHVRIADIEDCARLVIAICTMFPKR